MSETTALSSPLPTDPPRRYHALALGGYLLLSLIVTYPLLLHFTTLAIGEHYFDRTQSIWNVWWIQEALLVRHTNPFHTDLLFYPQGADLYFHDLSLPISLIMVAPLLLLGPAAAFNFGVLVALTLTGYTGFRLVLYLTRSGAGAFIGGLIIGFNPLMQEWIRGHINLLSAFWCVLCLEFYLRAWDSGRRRDAIITGIFFVLSILTVGYYELYLLLFFALHLLWALLADPGATWAARLRNVARRAAPLLGWAGGTAALLIAPYALGAWQSLQNGQTIARSPLDADRTIVDSADLLSFIVPDRDHWLFGIHAPWWQAINPAIHEYTTLGPITLLLALAGLWLGRRRARSWLWAALAVLGAALALGPILQVNGQRTFGGREIPMLFGLLDQVPPLSLMRAPERFVFLTYIALAVLAGQGIAEWMQRRRVGMVVPSNLQPPTSNLQRIPRSMILAGILILLLIEMPWHRRYMEAMTEPASMVALGQAAGPGAVLELPLTQHGWVDTPRMFNQMAHDRPITSGYLSRPVIDPYTQACSPLQAFSLYPHLPAQDIITPTVAGQLAPALLDEHGVGFIAVYKQEYVDPRAISPVSPPELAALQDLAHTLGTPIADDSAATIYRVRPPAAPTSLFLQLGPDWHTLEQSGGAPFRWIDGGQADFCVFSPTSQTAPLTMQMTSFATPRHLQIWLDDRQVLDTLVPADGALHPFSTPALAWPAGAQRVRLVVPEGSASPADLHQGTDSRQLSLGFTSIMLETGNK